MPVHIFSGKGVYFGVVSEDFPRKPGKGGVFVIANGKPIPEFRDRRAEVTENEYMYHLILWELGGGGGGAIVYFFRLC